MFLSFGKEDLADAAGIEKQGWTDDISAILDGDELRMPISASVFSRIDEVDVVTAAILA